MSTSRNSAVALLAAGVLAIVGVPLFELFEDWGFFAHLVSLALLLLGLPGLRAAQQGRDGRVGRAGMLVALVGAGLLLLAFVIGILAELFGGNPDELPFLGPLLLLGLLALIVGVVLLGAGMLRARALPAAVVFLFILGLPLALVIDLATGAFEAEEGQGPPQFGFYIGFPLWGLSLVLLGVLLRRGAAPPEPRVR